jgi:hypothetical protein
MATLKRIILEKKIKILRKMYEVYGRPLLSDGAFEMVLTCVVDLKPDQLDKACNRAMSKSRFCPTPADILEAHRELHEEWLWSKEWLCDLQPRIYLWMAKNTDYNLGTCEIYQDQLDKALDHFGLDRDAVKLNEMS